SEEHRGPYSCSRLVPCEVRIAEGGHPVIGVVVRVVNAVWAAKAPVRVRDPQVVVETGEVGAAARVSHGRLGALRGSHACAPGTVDAHVVSLRAGDSVCHGSQCASERWRATTAERGTGGAYLLVEIRHAVAREHLRLLFHVLGAADYPPLLGVPRAEDDGPARRHPVARQLADGTGSLDHAYGSAHIVSGPGAPRVAVGADDHNLI